MTYADFCQFCGSFIQHMLEMRIVRLNFQTLGPSTIFLRWSLGLLSLMILIVIIVVVLVLFGDLGMMELRINIVF